MRLVSFGVAAKLSRNGSWWLVAARVEHEVSEGGFVVSENRVAQIAAGI